MSKPTTSDGPAKSVSECPDKQAATENFQIAKPCIDESRAENASTAQISASALRSKINRRALEYWLKIRGTREMPSRADFDPLDITEILPSILLIDVARDPLDFRFRLIGTDIVATLNSDLTGQWMSEVPHQKPPSIIWSSCEAVVTRKIPMTTEIPYVGRNKDFKVIEDIVMPLSNDGQEVNMLLVAVDFFSRAASNP